jgi:flagellar motor switch protein FliM
MSAMSERQVLSSEEVDAILKVTQEPAGGQQHSLDTSDGNASPDAQYTANLLTNFAESTKIEVEKIIGSFLRKKIRITVKSFTLKKLSDCFKEAAEKSVFSVFHIKPNDNYGMLAMDLSFLHQIINHLYGGTIQQEETTMATPGKAGNFIAEKIYQLFLTGFAQACQEQGAITTEIVKTSALPSLTSNLVMDDNVYTLEMNFMFDEVESVIRCMIAEDFIKKHIFGTKKSEIKHREKDFWRTAIKSQVVDSFVSVSVTLPELNLKMNDFVDLKEGDLIPISDPTLVYICLNNLKLFRAKAGQANSKRVAKIVSQI